MKTLVIKIVPNRENDPSGKLADAELHFTEGALTGLKLIGFAIWKPRSGGGRTVTFPARPYTVNGKRRRLVLLRPVTDNEAQDRIRRFLLQAYAEHEAAASGLAP